MDRILSFQICFGLFLLTTVAFGKKEFECSANKKSKENYLNWANTLPVLVKQDKEGEN